MCKEVNLLEFPQRKEGGKYQKEGYKNKLANITSALYCNSFLTGLIDNLLFLSKALCGSQ